MINKRLEDLREVMRREHLAVGTGTWGIAAVIPKYLSLRLPRPPQPLSWLCRGLFVPSFRNFATKKFVMGVSISNG